MVLAVITVFGRTPRVVPGWTEPAATFQDSLGNPIEDIDITQLDREHKWRRIEVAAALRNYLF